MNSHSVIISLASNHDQEKNLHQARLCLEQILLQCHYTEEIWTEPIGSEASRRSDTSSAGAGANACPPTPSLYLNQLAAARTTIDTDQLAAKLKETELQLGRTDDCRRQGIVPIDLDLLLYDDRKFHLRDWSRPYVTALLPQLR